MGSTQYIGARYVPKFFDGADNAEWQPNISYEPLTIVTWLGSSWTSKKTVPSNVGAPNLNLDYWVNTGNFNQQIQEFLTELQSLRADVIEIDEDLDNYKTLNDGNIESINNNINTLQKYDKDIKRDALKGSYAHRGYGYNTQPLPEQSLPAFYMAKYCGFHGVEIDIQYDMNRNIVCMHDMTVDRTTDKTGRLSDYAYTDLYLKDNINGAVTTMNPPTLAQVLQLCKGCDLIPSIEFKYDSLSPYVDPDEVISMLESYGIENYILNITPISILSAEKYRNIWKVTNDYSTSGFTNEQAEMLHTLYGNVIIYLRSAFNIPDNNFTEIARNNDLMTIAWTTQPLTDTNNAPKADLYLSEISMIRSVITTYMSMWHNLDVIDPATTPDSGIYILKYRRAGNVVEIQGAVENLTLRATFATLPEGYRPSNVKRIPVFANRSDKHYIGDLFINTNGNLSIQNISDPNETSPYGFVIDVSYTIG